MLKTKPKLLTLSALRDRGWTPAMIAALLGEPDVIKPNPHYKKAAPMRCYDESRVLIAEQGAEFSSLQEGAAPRRVAARKAVETKREALLRQVGEMAVTVEMISTTEARRNAIALYNEWNADGVIPATLNSSRQFLDRITVNYLRHHLTVYDKALEEVVGRVGVVDAIRLIRQKVYGAIAETYPCYAAECKRQMEIREGEAADASR